MNEIITVNGVAYTVQNVTTGANSISFVLTDLTIEEAETAFKECESLTVGTEDTVYGEYPHVYFESVSKDVDGIVTVTMHIPTKEELQIKELQVSQAEQDEAIATLMFGGEANE